VYRGEQKKKNSVLGKKIKEEEKERESFILGT
jgi:hypothetical protein